jgi:hypothetical protein
MLENELESIFSAGKVAMKSIFKEEDKEEEENSTQLVNDSTKKVNLIIHSNKPKYKYCSSLLVGLLLN